MDSRVETPNTIDAIENKVLFWCLIVFYVLATHWFHFSEVPARPLVLFACCSFWIYFTSHATYHILTGCPELLRMLCMLAGTKALYHGAVMAANDCGGGVSQDGLGEEPPRYPLLKV